MSEPQAVVVDQEKLPFPEGYTTDLHAVELTRAQIDMLAFAAGSILGYVDAAAQANAITDIGAGFLDEGMNRLLDKSESFR